MISSAVSDKKRKKFANVSCTGFVVKVALKNSVETYTLSHYIIVTLIIARISVSSKEKKKRRGGGVEWRKFTTVSGKVAKRDAERSFLESNCLPLNPASRLCSRVFVLTELIPSASRKEVADRGGPTPPSSLLRAITPRFNRDPRWSSRRQFITSRWATLRALLFLLSNRSPNSGIILWSLPLFETTTYCGIFFFFNHPRRLYATRWDWLESVENA